MIDLSIKPLIPNVKVVAPPTKEEIEQHIIDQIISDNRIYDKISAMQNVRDGNYVIKPPYLYIGTRDIPDLDFKLDEGYE